MPRIVHPRNPWISNPLPARLLIFLNRRPIPVLTRLTGIVLNCDFYGRLKGQVFMPHPYGIIVSSGAEIGNNVVIMQQVTIGGKDLEFKMPTIEDDVYIGAGAKVLGDIRVGKGATIGANAVVTKDVPPGCVIVGANQILRPKKT